MRLLAVLAFATLVLSGCGGPGKAPQAGVDTGRIDQSIADGAVDGVAGGNGEILGTVQDDAGLPVGNALVSLLGTELSATSNATGGFRFTNISAGTHTLRVLADGSIYRIHEGDVTVVAERATLVTVTLVPLDARGPGYRPHLHDYWGDKTELDLFEMDLDWGKSGSYTAYGAAGELVTEVYQPNNGNWWLYFGIPDRDDERPPIVLPGTAQVRFAITWDEADVDVDRFILGFHPGDNKYRDQPAASNGQEFTVDLEAGDTDNGHQSFSLWQFHLKPEARTVPMTILGPIHVTAVLVKGVLPVDPPHEDFWGPNTTYLSRAWDTPVPGISTCCVEAHITVAPDSKRLIPPGTQSLAIRLGYASTYAPGTAADLEWELLAKPADLRPATPLEQYELLVPVKEGTGLKEYLLPLDGSETDAFYQVHSNWRFVIRQQGIDLTYGLAEAGHKFNLEVIANKDPGFV